MSNSNGDRRSKACPMFGVLGCGYYGNIRKSICGRQKKSIIFPTRFPKMSENRKKKNSGQKVLEKIIEFFSGVFQKVSGKNADVFGKQVVEIISVCHACSIVVVSKRYTIELWLSNIVVLPHLG